MYQGAAAASRASAALGSTPYLRTGVVVCIFRRRERKARAPTSIRARLRDLHTSGAWSGVLPPLEHTERPQRVPAARGADSF